MVRNTQRSWLKLNCNKSALSWFYLQQNSYVFCIPPDLFLRYEAIVKWSLSSDQLKIPWNYTFVKVCLIKHRVKLAVFVQNVNTRSYFFR